MKKLLDFVKARVNPFRMPKARIPLYNIVILAKEVTQVIADIDKCDKTGDIGTSPNITLFDKFKYPDILCVLPAASVKTLMLRNYLLLNSPTDS